ncbi:hypothetical protein MCNS_35870 [Mycobacterium conspicuum]|uniref:Uncharacterized protein n=1 Tax=Mycobacterium conspicuum TaxID=44010 RepID=A0A7I7YH08_9MYCO|nr:hypothetical protein MCNS_35870 [Mycobacterium conspicuum]
MLSLAVLLHVKLLPPPHANRVYPQVRIDPQPAAAPPPAAAALTGLRPTVGACEQNCPPSDCIDGWMPTRTPRTQIRTQNRT